MKQRERSRYTGKLISSSSLFGTNKNGGGMERGEITKIVYYEYDGENEDEVRAL